MGSSAPVICTTSVPLNPMWPSSLSHNTLPSRGGEEEGGEERERERKNAYIAGRFNLNDTSLGALPAGSGLISLLTLRVIASGNDASLFFPVATTVLFRVTAPPGTAVSSTAGSVSSTGGAVSSTGPTDSSTGSTPSSSTAASSTAPDSSTAGDFIGGTGGASVNDSSTGVAANSTGGGGNLLSSTGAAAGPGGASSSTGSAPIIVLPPLLAPSTARTIPYSGNSTSPCASSSPCLHGGSCSFSAGNFTCACQKGFFSPTCGFGLAACEGCITSFSGASNKSIRLIGTGFDQIRLINISGVEFDPTRLRRSRTNSAAARGIGSSSFQWPEGVQVPEEMDVLELFPPVLVSNNDTERWEPHKNSETAQSRDRRYTQSSSSSRRLLAAPTAAVPPSAVRPLTSRYQPVSILLQDSDSAMLISYSKLIFYSSSNCIAEGEFQPDGRGGCTSCPVGGFCPGGGRVYPLPGYWSNSYLVPPSACPYPPSCPGVDRDSIKGIDGDSEADIQTGVCTEEYKGPMCTSCALGFYRSGDSARCWSCGSDSSSDAYFSMILIIALLVLVLLSLAVCFLNSAWLANMVVGFVIVQSMVVIGQAGLQNLPSEFQGLSSVFTVLSVLNFDLAMFKQGCSVVPQFSYLTKLFLTVAYAILFIVAFIVACYCRRWLKLRAMRKQLRTAAASASSVGRTPPPRLSDAHYKKANVDFRRRCTHSLLILGTIFYYKMASLAFQGVHCVNGMQQEQEGGDTGEGSLLEGDAGAGEILNQLHLYVDPSILCFKGNHAWAVVFIGLLLVFYVAGFPLLCLVVLVRTFAHESSGGLTGFLWRHLSLFRSKEINTLFMRNRYVVEAEAEEQIDGGEPTVKATAMVKLPMHLRSPSSAATAARRMSVVFDAYVEDAFGFLFSGLSHQHFAFRLTFLLVQLASAAVSEFITAERISLRLFLLGLIFSAETLLICIQLPFASFALNFRNAIILWGEMTHALSMLGLQGESDQGSTPLFYAFLGIHGCICLFLLTRRKVGQWIGMCEVPEDVEDINEENETEKKKEEKALEAAQLQAAMDDEGEETAALARLKTKGQDNEARSPLRLLSLQLDDPTQLHDLYSPSGASLMTSPAASPQPEARTLESQLQLQAEEQQLQQEAEAVVAAAPSEMFGLLENMCNSQAAETEADTVQSPSASAASADSSSTSSASSLSSGLHALRFAASLLVKKRLAEAEERHDAAAVDHFSQLYRELVEHTSATSAQLSVHRSAADDEMMQRLKRGKTKKAQKIIDQALDNDAMLQVFRLEEEDRQRQIMETKIRLRKEKKEKAAAAAAAAAAGELNLPLHSIRSLPPLLSPLDRRRRLLSSPQLIETVMKHLPKSSLLRSLPRSRSGDIAVPLCVSPSAKDVSSGLISMDSAHTPRPRAVKIRLPQLRSAIASAIIIHGAEAKSSGHPLTEEDLMELMKSIVRGFEFEQLNQNPTDAADLSRV